MPNKNLDLARSITCNIFATRDTVDEALGYATQVLKNNPAALTALYVVMNSVAHQIVRNEQAVSVDN